MPRIALSVAAADVGCDGETIDAIAVADQRLQMIEMHPHAVLGARDFGRIRAPAHEGGHSDRVTGSAWCRREDEQIAELDSPVRGQSLVDRDGARKRVRTYAVDLL